MAANIPIYKLAAWSFYKERLEQYFMITHSPKEDMVTHILFFGGKEASERWAALNDWVEEDQQTDADTVFEAFASSFEKSSGHWQARDKYLSNIKQGKQHTTAELDMYIKDLMRRCQFKQAEQEPCKIDLLYHATAHFEVRKFVHNAKPEELTYHKMIEVAKAHERTCHKYQVYKQAHSMAPKVITLILCFKQALCWSLFRKTLPRRPVANLDAHTTTLNAQPLVLYAVAVTRRTTGSNSVETLGGGTVHEDIHPPHEGHRNRGKEDTLAAASSSTKTGDAEELANTIRTLLLRSQVLDGDVEGHTR